MNELKAGATAPRTGMSNGSQMRITDQDRELIQRTFSGNESLLLLLRKVFLPEIDPVAPIGQGIDLWMTIQLQGLSPEEQITNIKARNQLITHIDQCLLTLKLNADMKILTAEELAENKKKDGTK